MLIESKVTCYGQVAQTSAMCTHKVVRNIFEILYTLREHQLLVLSNGRTILVKIRKIICHKCDKNYFYVEIQTRIQSEILTMLSDKFVCPKCRGVE